MKKTNNKVVVYARTACVSQDGISSIDSQLNTCISYAIENNLQIVKVFTSLGSANNKENLQQIFEFVDKNKEISKVLVYKIDRWTRNVEQGLIAEAYLAKNDVSLVSVTENFHQTPTSKFIKVILTATAELDNNIKAQRVKNSMKMLFQNGNWMWKAPLGYKRDKNKNILVDRFSAEMIEDIFDLACDNYSIPEIINEVNNFGFYDVILTKSLVKKIISNPFYKGFMKASFCDDLVRGNHKALVSSKQWNKANQFLVN